MTRLWGGGDTFKLLMFFIISFSYVTNVLWQSVTTNKRTFAYTSWFFLIFLSLWLFWSKQSLIWRKTLFLAFNSIWIKNLKIQISCESPFLEILNRLIFCGYFLCIFLVFFSIFSTLPTVNLPQQVAFTYPSLALACNFNCWIVLNLST